MDSRCSTRLTIVALIPNMKITAKELIRELQKFHPDTEIDFSPLNFSRIRTKGDLFARVEFEEVWESEDDTRIVLAKPPG